MGYENHFYFAIVLYISIRDSIVAHLYNLSSYDMVTVTKINPKSKDQVLHEVSADFVMVTMKDQFISRGEMFHYQNTLLGKWCFVGERLVNKDVSYCAFS
jgi:hypothetical protein